MRVFRNVQGGLCGSLLLLLALAGGLFAVAPRVGSAQVFGPPMTVFGSVTDSAGRVPDDLPIEAYIGDKVCGRGKTQSTGDGDGRVTVYFADVVSREQTAGCGSDGADVRIKVGDRFAQQTVKWRPGPAQLDLTFGSATPAPIPTFTPTPRRTATADATQRTTTPAPQSTASTATADTGTPTPTASASPSPSASPATATSTATATPTLRGGVASSQQGGGDGDGGDGFPVWAAVALVLGGIALVGGGVGFAMARNRGRERSEADPFNAPE